MKDCQDETTQAMPPVIKSFHIVGNPSRIYSDRPLRLEWEVDGASELELNSYSLPPSQTSLCIDSPREGRQTYRLTAKSATGYIAQSPEVAVEVLPAVLGAFQTTAPEVTEGKRALIAWKVKNASSVVLQTPKGERKKVRESEHRWVKPRQTEQYDIIATGLDGEREFPFTVTVNVTARCSVEFSASRLFTFPDMPVTLQWQVRNAEKVILDGFGDQLPEGKLETTIERDTCFVLRVVDAYGETTRRVDVKLLRVPMIERVKIALPRVEQTLNLQICPRRFSLRFQPRMIVVRHLAFGRELPRLQSKFPAGPVLLRPKKIQFKFMKLLRPVLSPKFLQSHEN